MEIIENYKYKSLTDFSQNHVWYGRQGKAFYYRISSDAQVAVGDQGDCSPLLTAIPTINT